MVDLSGYKALVTGGRIKIGFHSALKLLRCGAEVALTTRFTENALARLRAEADFPKWEDRLHVIPADFRSVSLTEGVAETVQGLFGSLDILINNAAQTLRRPPQFFAHLLADELGGALGSSNNGVLSLPASKVMGWEQSVGKQVEPHQQVERTADVVAQLSQIPLLPGDDVWNHDEFPEGGLDEDGQQEDRRDFNSWMMKLEDVSLVELLEVLHVNVIAPFILCARLKKMMARRPDERPSFVVNVSAMEGNFFDREKNPRHPHTNMAKAALNMLTRTASLEFVESGILMTAVDPGWVTNERPFPLGQPRESRRSKMAIDAVDGAARICDPIFRAVSSDERLYGVFLKNYSIHPW
jgi:NAD(P)-dependent dehydrogenase (short-subunit alcohol dehydrogenase family)